MHACYTGNAEKHGLNLRLNRGLKRAGDHFRFRFVCHNIGGSIGVDRIVNTRYFLPSKNSFARCLQASGSKVSYVRRNKVVELEPRNKMNMHRPELTR